MELTKDQIEYFTETYLSQFPKDGSYPEDSHIKADAILVTILLELGLEEIVETYSGVNKWYS